jgi:hypothetical protein
MLEATPPDNRVATTSALVIAVFVGLSVPVMSQRRSAALLAEVASGMTFTLLFLPEGAIPASAGGR